MIPKRNLSIIGRRDSKYQEFYQSKSVFSRMSMSQNRKNPLPEIRKDSNTDEVRRRSSQAKESNTSLPYQIRDRSNSTVRKESIAQKRRTTMTQRRGTISVKKLDNSQERDNLLKKITSMDTLSAVIRTKNKLKKSVLNTVVEEKETKDDFVKTTRQAMATARAIKKFSKKKKDARSFRKGPKSSLMDTNATTVRFRLADEQGNMKMSKVALHDTLTPRETVTDSIPKTIHERRKSTVAMKPLKELEMNELNESVNSPRLGKWKMKAQGIINAKRAVKTMQEIAHVTEHKTGHQGRKDSIASLPKSDKSEEKRETKLKSLMHAKKAAKILRKSHLQKIESNQMLLPGKMLLSETPSKSIVAKPKMSVLKEKTTRESTTKKSLPPKESNKPIGLKPKLTTIDDDKVPPSLLDTPVYEMEATKICSRVFQHDKQPRNKSMHPKKVVRKYKISTQALSVKSDLKKIIIDKPSTTNLAKETDQSQQAVNEYLFFKKRHQKYINAFISDKLAGGIFHQYLSVFGSFSERSLLCLAFVQDMYIFEESFPYLNKPQKVAAFESILLKNLPCQHTILNELPGIRQHWNKLLAELNDKNTWSSFSWRLHALKTEAYKLLIVEYTRFRRTRLRHLLEKVTDFVKPSLSPKVSASEIPFAKNDRSDIFKFTEQHSDSEELDSDQEIEKDKQEIQKHKEKTHKQQMMASLPFGKASKFLTKNNPLHVQYSNEILDLSKPLFLSCFSTIIIKPLELIRNAEEKIFINHQTVPAEILAPYSLKQYPEETMRDSNVDEPYIPGHSVINARLVERTKRGVMIFAIRKNGRILKRPSSPPKMFMEILKNEKHIEFFARYLKTMQSDGPLLFWRCVEHIVKVKKSFQINQQRIVSNKILSYLKQKYLFKKTFYRVRKVLRKFFFFGAKHPDTSQPLTTVERLQQTFNYLQCNADIIRGIVEAETDKISMSILTAAQTAVARNLEKVWCNRYYRTFEREEKKKKSEETLSDDDSEVSKKIEIGKSDKSKIAWGTFYQFMRRSARFINAMKNAEMQSEFRAYLQKFSKNRKRGVDILDGGDFSMKRVCNF